MKTLFINTDIFPSEKDYVIGGFYNEDNKIENLREVVRTRLMELMMSFLQEEQRSYLASLGDGEKVDDNHSEGYAIEVIQNYLGITAENGDVSSLMDAIMESEQMVSWLAEKHRNITKYVIKGGQEQIKVAVNVVNTQFNIDEAKTQMEEANFLSFLEELSMKNI